MIDLRECFISVLRKMGYNNHRIKNGLDMMGYISVLPLSAQIITYGSCLDLCTDSENRYILGYNCTGFDEGDGWGYCADGMVWNTSDRPIEDVAYWSEGCSGGRVFLTPDRKFKSQQDVDISRELLNILKRNNTYPINERKTILYECVDVTEFAKHVHANWDVFKDHIIPDMDTLPSNWDNYSLNHIKVMLNSMIKKDCMEYERIHKAS